jgi:hypothetical protein
MKHVFIAVFVVCLLNDYYFYKGGVGIPSIKWYGHVGKYNALVIDLLGPSLENMFNKCNRF